MKKLMLCWMFLHILLTGQSQDWKKISTPRKSYLNILYQNQKGQILAETKPRIGFVSSVDDGISWQFIDKIDIYFFPKIFTEDKNGDIFLFWRNTILKYNFISTAVDTVYKDTKVSIDIVELKSIGNDVVLALYKGGTVTKFDLSSSNGNQQLVTTKIERFIPGLFDDKAYAIRKVDENNKYLLQINDNGTNKQLSKLTKEGNKYFFQNDYLICDDSYSTDFGVTWRKYNLPFAQPDSIFLYNGLLAFSKDNSIYYQQGTANQFSKIDLPANTDILNTFVGKNIITQNKNKNIDELEILRSQNGIFEKVNYDIATFYADNFVAGPDEQLLVSYANSDVFYKGGSNENWGIMPVKSLNYRMNLSFAEDNSMSIIDDNLVLQTSFNRGQTWQAYDHQNTFIQGLYSKKNAIFAPSDEALLYRKTNEQNWHKVPFQVIDATEIVEVSNQADIYKNYWGADQLIQSDTLNNIRELKDMLNFNSRTATHYEMDLFYNLSYKYNLADRKYKYELFSSYDKGFTFQSLHQFSWTDDFFSEIISAPSGHLILVKNNNLLVSSDEGKTWQQINVDLEKNDRIHQVSVSKDNYIYINTWSNGILKYLTPLSKPNILSVQLNDDHLNDCDTSNDTKAITRIKTSIKDLSSQLTDISGNAVFYTHNDQNKLFVHNENEIFDFCIDTISVNFLSGGDQKQSIKTNATASRQCAQLDVKIVNFNDATFHGVWHYVLIKNSGNITSEATTARITLDPYQYLVPNQYNGVDFLQVGDGVYEVNIPSLEVNGEFTFNITSKLLPYVPFDRVICMDVKLDNQSNQCLPNKETVKCNPVNRNGKNKTIALKFFEDQNSNCIKDLSEKYTNGHFYILNNERDLIQEYDSVKYIITSLDTNTIKFIFNDKLYSFCQTVYPVSIHKDSLLHSIEIPIKTLDHCSEIELKGLHGTIRPCFDRGLGFSIVNNGNVTSGPLNVKINIDPAFIVSNITPNPITTNGNEYIFAIDPIEPLRNRLVQFHGSVDCEDPIGLDYCFSVEVNEGIIPYCQTNNEIKKTTCIRSIGSYDPNDKSIFVAGSENEVKIQKDELIEYRIRFQNTGTDTAYTVRIEDKISEKFNIESIRLTNYTHECTWKVENKILIVTFNNINLVDSFTNNEGSNGFVVFEIKLKGDISVNDEIRNRASIYFDFNEPIITNEVLNYFGNSLINVDETLNGINYSKIVCVPNPTSGYFSIINKSLVGKSNIMIYDINGRLCKVFVDQTLGNQFNISDLISGTYIIKVVTAEGILQGRLVKIGH